MDTVPRYRKAFWNRMRNDKFNNADLQIYTPATTGHYLPKESEAKFKLQQERMNVFRRIATVIYTENAESKIKSVSPNGTAGFVAEGMAIPEISLTVPAWPVKAHKIAGLAKVSSALISDAGFDLESALAGEFGYGFGKVEEKACINGNGEGRPFGILNSEEGAEIGATVASGEALDFDDIIALYFSLKAEYRRSAVWLMSDETAMSLRKLKDDTESPLWGNTDDTILGKPVYTSPYMPKAESGNKAVAFGDFSFYWLIERGGVTLKVLHEKYAESGLTGFIGTEFIDGRLVRPEAVKALKIA